MARRVMRKGAEGGGSPAPLDQRGLVDVHHEPPKAELNGDPRAVPGRDAPAFEKLPLSMPYGQQKLDGEALHGFRPMVREPLLGGAAVTWWANEEARYLVVVDELRCQAGAGVPRGALVFIEPGEGTTQEQVDAAERAAVELGAVAVRKLPVREQGTGAAPEVAPAGADVTLREAVDQAIEKLPADVREGARRRADQFLSAEKV